MTAKQIEREIKLAVNAYILQKSLPKLIWTTLGYTAIVIFGFYLLIQVGKPHRFPILLPFGILITYPVIWYATLKDAKDAFYNRGEDEKFADMDKIWKEYNENKNALLHKLAISYEFFTKHSKLFIFLVLVLILIALLSK